MTKEEIRAQKKATALNKIRKLYNTDTFGRYTYYPGDGSHGEQRDDEVSRIMEDLEKELKNIK
jgi:hypothetical protein